MALETPKTKSEIKANITSLESRIKNQENLVKGFETIIDNLNSKIASFQRFVNIEKLLRVETNTEKIAKLNTEKAELINKYSTLAGKNQAVVEAEIVSLEQDKKDRQKDLDKEIVILDEDKLNLRDHKAIDGKRPFLRMSKSGIYTTVGVAAAVAFGGLFHEIFGSKNDKDLKDDKGKTEQTAPKTDITIKKGGDSSTYVISTPDTSKVKDSDSNKGKVNKGDKENKNKDLNKAKADQEKKMEDLRKKNQDLENRLKNTGSKSDGSGESRDEKLEQLRKKLTKTSDSDNLDNDYESGSGYRGDVNKTINVVDQRTGKIIGKKTIVEKGNGPETGSQNLTKEEFEKYKNNLVKVGKAEKHETTSQEKITDESKIEALNKMSKIAKDAGFSEKEIVESIEKKSDVTLKKVGKAEKRFYINGVELKNSGISIEKPKPGDNYYKHNGFWYEYPKN